MFDFSDQVVLVTGAGSGIGKTTAEEFAAAGATVIASDINGEAAQATASAIEAAGGTAVANTCDVADDDSVQAMIAMIRDQFGKLDAAFNNAGIVQRFEHLHTKSVADFDKVIAVNLRGVFLCMKYEIPLMLEHGGGAIVNTSSTAGLVAVPGIVDYVASKHAVAGMTKAAAIEYATQGIRVNAVHPAGVETPMIAGMDVSPEIAPLMESASSPTPAGRMAQTTEIAQAVMWLCSQQSTFVTGVSLPIDGGTTAI